MTALFSVCVLSVLRTEDNSGHRVHGVYDGQGMKVDPHLADLFAAVLESFFYYDAGTHELRACLVHQVREAEDRLAVGKEVIDDQDPVAGKQETLRDNNVVRR